MRRNLHIKLVLIMVLLIVSLMVVVGAFLMNSVTGYYINEFYQQIADAFGQNDFVRDLQTVTQEGEDGAAMVKEVLDAYAGILGVDRRDRNFYVLDGVTGRCLGGSATPPEGGIPVTPNISSALLGGKGFDSSVTADYMDAAIPITRGGHPYIVYILDGRETARSLNASMFSLIVEALALGLIISILLSFLLSKTMVDPLQRLTNGIEEVARGDFSRKLEITSSDEIGQLTESFNAMAQQLETTIAAVENERNKLDTLFLHMADGVVAFDRAQRVIHSNPAAARLLGRAFTQEDTYGELFGDLFPFEQAEAADGHLAGSRTVGGRFLELLLAPYARASQGGVLVLIHDVTEQRRAEQQRKDFVANVSHELRTPLTNIKSYAETLADGVGELPPEMEQRFLGVILNESDRMTHILQDLLTLSRFDSGRSELRLTEFPFAQAVNDTYQAILMDAQNHAHTVELNLPDSLPQVRADRERVMQVMMNIVSNAIKYTPDGGRIVLSAGQDGDKVWMEVDDNGIGIPESDRGRIFERFYRVDKARSRQSGGTGLGLSIAQEIMKQHEGGLYLVDKTEPGLTIRMELPVCGPREEDAHEG
ncbi:MAG: cell wall metabolism sensor histidine kinase WalK [Oscillospiraceae bacterium]|nr:cell wall metabolism sensor histidine kinase WalK [Oscillospiraceae bacterium]